jgi:hypothetical protein
MQRYEGNHFRCYHHVIVHHTNARAARLSVLPYDRFNLYIAQYKCILHYSTYQYMHTRLCNSLVCYCCCFTVAAAALSIVAHVLLLSAGVVQCCDSTSYQGQCIVRSMCLHSHMCNAFVSHLHVTGAIACFHALLVHVVMIQQHLRCAKCTTKQHWQATANENKAQGKKASEVCVRSMCVYARM